MKQSPHNISESTQPTLLLVAKIGRVVGFSGTLKLHITTDFPHIFKPGATFHLNKALFIDTHNNQSLSKQHSLSTNSPHTTKIETLCIASFEREKSLVVFKGFSSRQSAARLVNYELYSTLEESRAMCNLKEGEFLWEELLGAEVRDFKPHSESTQAPKSLSSKTPNTKAHSESSPDSDISLQAKKKSKEEGLEGEISNEEAGELLGCVRAIERIGEVDYFCIDTHLELVQQGLPKSFLVPYIPQYVLSLSKNTISTHHAKALLENS